MLELAGVSKRFGERVALHPVRLSLEAGRTLALLGPSGSGKTTLLRISVGLLRPDEGSVLLDGQVVEPWREPTFRRRLGLVVQGGGLFPHLTAEQNVTLVARELGWPAQRMAQRLAELASLTRFPEGGLGRRPAELSGGQVQRVSLMRALMLDPPLLLLDEPFGALDPITRADLQDELRALFATLRKAVLLVTHDLGEAAYLGHRIALMQEGRVVQLGSYPELLEQPATPFVTRFLRAGRLRPAGEVGP